MDRITEQPIAVRSPFAINCRIRLLVFATRVIHVTNAVITAERDETKMTPEKEATNTDTGAAVAAQGANVAPEKAFSKKTTIPKKDAPKSQKSAKGGKRKAGPSAKPKKTTPAKKNGKTEETAGPREGTKTSQVVAMLQRKNGATLAEIMEKMGWQKHTVRGFIAGAMKKAGYTVESFKSDKGERTYRINQ